MKRNALQVSREGMWEAMPVFILLLYLLVGVSRHKALAILKITFSHGFEGIMSFSSRAKNPCAFLNSGACL